MKSPDYIPRHLGTGKSEQIDIFNNGDYVIPACYQYKGKHMTEMETPIPEPAKARGAFLLRRLIHPPAIPKP